MTISMYQASVPVFARMLGNLRAILDKAAAHARAKGIEEAVLLDARLYPDMFPFTRQVQLACDFGRGTGARLAGKEPRPRTTAPNPSPNSPHASTAHSTTCAR